MALQRADVRTILLVVAVHLALILWALELVAAPENISLMWLPDGFLLGALLLLERRLWLPVIVVLAPAVAALELVVTDRPATLIAAFLVANLVESVGGAAVLRRYATDSTRFVEFRDLGLFLVACVLALPLLGGLVGAQAVVAHDLSDDFFQVYRTWVMSAGLGILFVAPLVLYATDWVRRFEPSILRQQVPLLGMAALGVLVIVLPVRMLDLDSGGYLVSIFVTLPLLIGSALRYGLWGALLFSSVLVVTSVHLTAFGSGPFSLDSVTSSEAVVRLQSYLGSVIIASLFTGLAIEKSEAARRRLQDSERRLAVILDTLPYGIQENGVDGTISYSNPAHHEILGYEPPDLVGRPIWHAAVDSEAADSLKEHLGYLVRERPDPTPYTSIDRTADGAEVTLEINWDYRLGASGEVEGFVSVISDITQRQLDEKQLRQYAEIFRSTAEGVMVTDLETRIIDVNHAFSEITGYAADEIVGRRPSILRSERHDDAFYRSMWQAIDEIGHWRGEIWNRRKNGEVYPELLTISAVEDEHGAKTGYVAVFTDITLAKRSEERLAYLAHHDALTGLPNRVLLHDRLTQSIRRADRHDEVLAVVFVDLDNFKTVNDSLGHAAGDLLLMAQATRLCEAVRDEDSVARISGDEFVLLIPGGNDVDGFINAINRIMRAFETPVAIGEHDVMMTASVGISLYPHDGRDAETLIRNADTAMYSAKEDGRNTYRFYAEEMTSVALEHLFIENALRKALASDELFLVYQPQYVLRSGCVSGVEALIRWRHPDQGLIPPSRFIPIAEQSGLIREIGRWVLDTACTQGAAWLAEGCLHGRIAVNIAEPQLRHPDFAAEVMGVLETTGLPPDRLELEVTERFVVQQTQEGIGHLKSLRDAGVQIAIDDFGTGYSSLSYLKSLPIDKLKIDQSFVQGIPEDASDMAISEAIITLANAMNLTAVAEGIETHAQAAFFTSRDCREGQGYLFSRPVEAAAMRDILEAPVTERR